MKQRQLVKSTRPKQGESLQARASNERYFSLLRKKSIVPRLITSDREYQTMLLQTGDLITKEKRTQDESRLLALLIVLIKHYESGRFAFEESSPAEIDGRERIVSKRFLSYLSITNFGNPLWKAGDLLEAGCTAG